MGVRQSELTYQGPAGTEAEGEGFWPTELEVEVCMHLGDRLAIREGQADGSSYSLRFYEDKFSVELEGGAVWSMPRLTEEEQLQYVVGLIVERLTDLMAAQRPLQ